MLAGRRIAVVIPAYNEERLLPQTLASLPGYVDTAVVVDDASSDRTGEVARQAGARRSVALVRHDRNSGVGAAIVTGYRWCLDHDVDIAVVVGADNQMHPDDMAALLLPLLQGDADYAVGNRLAWPGGWRRFPAVRLFGVVALAAMTRWATGLDDIQDAQCGYTAISAEALGHLDLDALYPRYGFPNDLLSKIALKGLRVTTRPVRPIYAGEQSALKIRKVVGPLLGLTLRSYMARHGLTKGTHATGSTEDQGSRASKETVLGRVGAERV